MNDTEELPQPGQNDRDHSKSIRLLLKFLRIFRRKKTRFLRLQKGRFCLSIGMTNIFQRIKKTNQIRKNLSSAHRRIPLQPLRLRSLSEHNRCARRRVWHAIFRTLQRMSSILKHLRRRPRIQPTRMVIPQPSWMNLKSKNWEWEVSSEFPKGAHVLHASSFLSMATKPRNPWFSLAKESRSIPAEFPSNLLRAWQK